MEYRTPALLLAYSSLIINFTAVFFLLLSMLHIDVGFSYGFLLVIGFLNAVAGRIMFTACITKVALWCAVIAVLFPVLVFAYVILFVAHGC